MADNETPEEDMPSIEGDGVFDAVTQMVETWGGMKAQFVNHGWDNGNAELMTIELLRHMTVGQELKAAELRASVGSDLFTKFLFGGRR